MTEQGLKTVVYPEIDEMAMQMFVDKFNEYMKGTFVNVGVSSSDGGGGGGTDTLTGMATNQSPTSSEQQKKDTADAIVKANEDMAYTKPQIEEKKQKGVTDKLGGILGVAGSTALAVGVGAVGVATLISGIFKFLEDSSPPLKTVMGLFETAFNMIWMPVGTILAVQLMPVLRDVMGKVAEWMARAWDLYDMEGWTGLIRGALETSFDILVMLLTEAGPIFGEILGTLIWEMSSKFGLLKVLEMLGVEIPTFHEAVEVAQKNLIQWGEDISAWAVDTWNGVVDWWSGVENGWNEFCSWISGVFETIQAVIETIKTSVGDVFTTIGSLPEKVFDSFKSFFQPIVSFWDGLTLDNFVSKLVDAFREMLKNILNIGGKIADKVSEVVPSEVKNVVKNIPIVSDVISKGSEVAGSVVSGVKSFLGLAEGGVVTEPTWRLFGEAGPEAVIPLNQLSSVVNDYNNNVGSVGNNITINISGNNAVEIGDQVQRVLEKTVGKASSKLMWW